LTFKLMHYCPRCKAEAERQSYVYESGEFKCLRCEYTGYHDGFERKVITNDN
jgi:transposase-like protein